MRKMLVVLLGVLGAAMPLSAQEVTFESLLREMTSMERLAEQPNPAYVTRQFASYDRKSTDPAVPTEENWFANHDRNQVLRAEETVNGTEHVLMDAAGPGALVRFWSANANDGGIVRVYLDENPEPLFELPLQAMLGGDAKPFVKPIAHVVSRGWNSYLPIPYAKHCKVTVTNPDIYQQLNYRTYAPGAKVRTLTLAELERHMPLVRQTAAALAAPATAAVFPENAVTAAISEKSIGAGESMERFLVLDGPGAVCSFECKVTAADLPAALRGCLLEIAFDGDAPSVVAPLGDFFGTAPGLNAFAALPCGVLEDGTLYSRWVMPFNKEAAFTIRNHSGADAAFSGKIVHAARPFKDASLRFHAKWRTERELPTRPMVDWNYLGADGGPGRFAGVMLHINNPVPDWWGEGDEKIYVDGETFPSHFGTGTEDYFGYAWCSPDLFNHAYHCQPRCDGPANFGQTCVSRFHIMDDIPWNTSFRFDMEMWHWKADIKVAQSVTAYWYAAPAAKDNTPLVEPALLTVPPVGELRGMKSAIEAETMKVLEVGGGVVEKQDSIQPWSMARQLWWRDAKPGQKLVLAFEVKKAGKYEVYARLTSAPDYGIHQFHINGQPAGAPVDLYAPEVRADKERSLGIFELARGDCLLEIEITGSNPDAEPRHMLGLDYVLLRKR